MGIIKKELLIFKVAAFIGPESLGNTAAVCLLPDWLPTRQLQYIASEIGLAETAFLKNTDDLQTWDIRWCTPEIEMDLCGHATLAGAFVLINEAQLGLTALNFNSVSGKLPVNSANGRIILDFPSREPQKCILPDIILKGIGLKPLETYKSRDYILIYEDEKAIRRISPDRTFLNQINLDPGGIVITAKGNKADFVSRFFTPQASIFEDPVTGSAHCSLIPYWSKRLNKTEMIAEQLSENRGILYCSYDNERVQIGGYCVIQNKETIRY